MTTPTTLPKPTHSVPTGVKDFGLGLGIDSNGYSYSGSIAGYSSEVNWISAKQLALAVMTNTSESTDIDGRYQGAGAIIEKAWCAFGIKSDECSVQ